MRKNWGRNTGFTNTEFEVPSNWKGKTVNIVFDGSMTDTQVKINGKVAGEIHQALFTVLNSMFRNC
jgi:hypothetical protein